MKKEPESRFKLFLTLILSTFKISAFTFGGGYVIVPLMRKKFVEELEWIDEAEMLDLVAIAQSSPGPIAINASLLIGYRMAGIPGAIASAFGTVMPPFIIMSIVSVFYIAFRENPVISAVLKAMQAAVAAVILDVVVNMARGVIKDKRITPVLIMVSAFAVSVVLDINVIFVILVCGTIGALFMRPDKDTDRGKTK